MTMVMTMEIGMTKTIAAGEFKAKCLSLMDEVEKSGEPLIVTKRGKPIVRLLPARSHRKSAFGAMRGSTVILGDIVAAIDEPWDALKD